jgi:acyl-CoA dehydrogenase
MFLVDVNEALDAGTLEMSSIEKTSMNLSHSFELWFNDLRVPAENLIGEEDRGFYQILDGLNEERLTVAAEAVGIGQAAITRAVDYANERVVFDRPIGKNQAIQHPLAKAYAHVQAGKHLTYNAANMVEDLSQKEVGVMANTAKFLTSEAAFAAADAAVQTHGGFGTAREYDVERFFRDARMTRIAPISQELALNYIGEQALGLPRSY